MTVSAVHPGSPAEIAGLQTDDILLKIDDQQILHPVQLQRLVARLPVDQEVVLAVRRGDETLSLNATLTPRPAELIAARRPIPPDFQLVPQPDWPEGFERMFRIEPLDMGAEPHDLRQMHERMRQHFDQLFEAPGLEMPEGLRMPMVPLPEPGEGLRMQSVRVVDDGQHRLTVTADAQGRHLKALAADGAVLFEGPINTFEELETVPEVIRDKIPLEQPNPRPARLPEGRAV